MSKKWKRATNYRFSQGDHMHQQGETQASFQARRRAKFDWARLVIAVVMLPMITGVLVSCASPVNTDAAGAPVVSVRVAPAVVGNITVSSQYVAEVKAKDQVDLMPLITGRIQQLNVDVGSEVHENQVIAELSHGTLDAQLRQAQAKLQNAEANLTKLQGEVSPNQLKAQAQVDAAKAKLEQLISPSPLDLQDAASSVNKAQSDLESAKTQLEQLEDPSEADITAAKAALAKAESDLSTTQAAANDAINAQLHAQMRPDVRFWWETVLRTRLSLQSDVAKLENLQKTYALNVSESDIAAAQQAIEQDKAVISSLIALIEDSSVIPREISKALWAETSAQKALEDAQTKLRQLQHPDQKTLDLARYRVDAAQASLDSAKSKLELLKDPKPSDVAAARSAVTEAEQALALAQDDQVTHAIAAAQALVAQAQAEVGLVEQQLSDTQIQAPFDGFISRRPVSLGAVVSPQTPIVTVTSKDMVVSVEVEEASINSLQPGQLINFTTPALPGRQLKLQVDWVSPSGDRQAHTFSVQLRPVGPPPGLKPGMSGDVSIETQIKNVVLVPKQAVQYREGESTLFVVQDGRAHLRTVTTGLENFEEIEVRSGLQAGEQVVVYGREYLQDGDSVAVAGVS